MVYRNSLENCLTVMVTGVRIPKPPQTSFDMVLTNDIIEWSTLLSEDTHGIPNITIFIFQNEQFIGISTNKLLSLNTEIVFINLITEEVKGVIDNIETIKSNIMVNKNLIIQYSDGDICASKLINEYKKSIK